MTLVVASELICEQADLASQDKKAGVLESKNTVIYCTG